MNDITQHDDCLTIAARIESFRRRYPNDADRLLAEYAGLEPVGCHDDEIEGIKTERDDALADVCDRDRELDAMEKERDGYQSDLAQAENRIAELEDIIEELEDRIEELENTKGEEKE